MYSTLSSNNLQQLDGKQKGLSARFLCASMRQLNLSKPIQIWLNLTSKLALGRRELADRRQEECAHSSATT